MDELEIRGENPASHKHWMGQRSRRNASKHKAASYGRMLKQEKDLEPESDRMLRTNLDEEQGADTLSDELMRRESPRKKSRW